MSNKSIYWNIVCILILKVIIWFKIMIRIVNSIKMNLVRYQCKLWQEFPNCFKLYFVGWKSFLGFWHDGNIMWSVNSQQMMLIVSVQSFKRVKTHKLFIIDFWLIDLLGCFMTTWFRAYFRHSLCAITACNALFENFKFAYCLGGPIFDLP